MHDKYLYTSTEMQRCNEVEKLFDDFDQDRSGFLDFDEVTELFEENNIAVGRPELIKIFQVIQKSAQTMTRLRTLIKKKEPMRLYLEDLKKFVLYQSGRNEFRNIMRVVRRKAEVNSEKGPVDKEYSSYLPLNFEAMMQYLHYTNERMEISKSINLNHRELLDKIEKGADLRKET